MPFNKLQKLSSALGRYIEAENKRQNGESGEDQYNNIQQQHKGMMSSASSMMKGFKTPKMSIPKMK